MTTNPIVDRLKALNKHNPDLEYMNGDKRLPLYVWKYKKTYDQAIDELKKLKELLDLELISQKEFDEKSKELKKIILDN